MCQLPEQLLQGFGEIAFCAVSSHDQVKGFGSRLMSYTKVGSRKSQLTEAQTRKTGCACGICMVCLFEEKEQLLHQRSI